jgi:hypothetical protein
VSAAACPLPSAAACPLPSAAACPLPTVSVVIAAYTPLRWDCLRDAVASVRAQTVPPLETVVAVDHHPPLLALARLRLADVVVVPNTGSPGASATRNAGVAACHGEVVAFLDDDAVASPGWLAALLAHFADPAVVGAGGRVEPLWQPGRPRWFPPEFDWAVGASHPGMPGLASPVRNVWSNNMAIRRTVFDEVGGFRAGFGKVGGRSRPEDTDLCLRAAAARPGGAWIYEPAAVTGHQVPRDRGRLGYFLRRCFNEGRGKAELAAMNGTRESTRAERQYTRQVLPRGFTRGLREAVRGDLGGGSRSLAIAAGFSAAASGFAVGWVARAPGQTAGRGQTAIPGQTAGPGQAARPAAGAELPA